MKHLYLFVSFSIVTLTLNAQDPYFTQFYANPAYMNPAALGTAFLGEQTAGRMSLQYRNQWHALPGNNLSLLLGYDQHFDRVNGGVGVQYSLNVAGSGLLTTSGLTAGYAPCFKLGKGNLRLGLQFTSYNRTLNISKLKFGDQLDPNVFVDMGPPVKSAINYFNYNSGILITQPKYYAGVALFNMNQPNWSFYLSPNEVQPMRISIHGGYHFRLGKVALTPQAQFQKQKSVTSLLIGAQASSGYISLGASYMHLQSPFRNAEMVATSIGFNFDKIRFIYSYDFTISDGRSAIPSSHELSMRFCWRTKNQQPQHSNCFN